MGTPVAVGNVIDVVVYRVKAGVNPVPLVPASEATLVPSAKAGRPHWNRTVRLIKRPRPARIQRENAPCGHERRKSFESARCSSLVPGPERVGGRKTDGP